MKRVLNFRPLFVAFVFMLIGGLLLPFFYFLPTYAKAIIFVVLLLTLSVFYFAKFKKYFKYVAFIIVPLVLVFCVGGIRATINDNLIGNTYNAKIEAVATDTYNTEYNSIEVRNVVINGKKVNRTITAYIENKNVSEIAPGTVFNFVGDFKKQTTFTRLNTTNFGYVSFDYEDAEISKTKMTLAETIRGYIKGNLSKIKNEEVSGLCYAVLFGNKSDLSTNMQANFTLSGTAHLLAVSGLHVGFLITVLMFILKLCKAGRKTKLIVPIVFLSIFMFLCAFSKSVVRASVIAIVYLLAEFFGKEKDQLSTLSFAGILLLAINPFNSVLYSFLLSFACVFSIICLANPLTNVFRKIKIWKPLAESLAVIICVNLATIPIVALMNQELNLMAFVSNIFLIPLFSLFYMVMFALVLLTTILPFASIILNAVFPFYFIFNIVQSLFNKVPPIIINSNVVIAILVLLLIFILSQFVFLKPKAKTMFSAFLCLLIIASFTTINVNYKVNSNKVYISESTISVLTTSEGTVVAFTDRLNLNTPKLLQRRLKTLQIAKADALVYLGEFDEINVKNFLDNSKVPLIVTEDYNHNMANFFDYKNFEILGDNKTNGVYVNGVYVYSFVTNNVNAIIFEKDNAIIVYTSFIKSNKAVNDIDEINPNIVYAKYLSSYVSEDFNSNIQLVTQNHVSEQASKTGYFEGKLKLNY